jgi:hypothetical protein
MFQGALAELALTSLLIGAPALIAVLWERRENRKFFDKIEEFRNDFN